MLRSTQTQISIVIAVSAMLSSQAAFATERPSATGLRVIPTAECIWSDYKAPKPATDRSAFAGVLEAFAPGLIDTGIGWIANMLQQAGQRKVTSRIASTGLLVGPSHQLPSCLQIVHGTFSLAPAPIDDTALPPARNPHVLQALLESGQLGTRDGKLPDLWLEVEVRYAPAQAFEGDDGPTSYALVPAFLAWTRSIANAKPTGRRDLLVFVNIAAPSSVAEEATSGLGADAASVARLTWYGVSAGRPVVNTLLAGATLDDKSKKTDRPKPVGLESLPATSSGWTPFPAIQSDIAMNVWVGVSEAKDGIPLLQKLGEALDARKGEVSVAVQDQVIPSRRAEVARVERSQSSQQRVAQMQARAKIDGAARAYKTACLALQLHFEDGASDPPDANALNADVEAARTAYGEYVERIEDYRKMMGTVDAGDAEYSEQRVRQLMADNLGEKTCGVTP